MDDPGPRSSLPTSRRVAIAVLAVGLFAFSAFTVYRSALSSRRMGDADVYFRAAWAIRSGADPYSTLDDNGWSYTYPPPLAILLTPLADAPPGEGRAWLFPFWASLTIWLALSWVFFIIAAHWTAKAVEESSPDPAQREWPVGCRRWWQIRVQPLVLCLIGVCATIARGQVNLLLLMLLSGVLLNVVRGRGLAAGLWLAAATCLKVIPAFLLIFALWRRDWRQLAGFAAGMVLLLAVLPAVTLGPGRAIELNRRFLDTMIFARYAGGHDQSKVREHETAIDNQSIMAILFNARHPGVVQRSALIQPDRVDRAAHWIIGAGLVIASLAAAHRRRRNEAERPRADLLLLGMLTCVMLAVSPLTHLHYFVLALPLVATLCAAGREGGTPTALSWVLALPYLALSIPPHLPGSRIAMYLGLATWTNLGLWAAGAWTLVWGRSWNAARRTDSPGTAGSREPGAPARTQEKIPT